MELPEAAIRWLAHYATSNVELAALSNVDRHWRQAVCKEVLTTTLEIPVLKKDDEVQHSSAASSPLSKLLLPTMVRSLNSRAAVSDYTSDDTFCLAWFHPGGIQFMGVPMGDPTTSDKELTPGHDSAEGFAPSGGDYICEEKSDDNDNSSNKKNWKPRGNTMKTTKIVYEARRRTCSYEWRGYRGPMDVLLPFGYASAFISHILDSAMPAPTSKQLNLDSSRKGVLSSLSSQREMRPNGNSITITPRKTSFAVRGATFARPDGYCLCWNDDGPISPTNNGVEPNGAISSAARNESQGVKGNGSSERDNVRHREYMRSRAMRSKRQRELQQLALPRMMLSTPDKRPGILDPEDGKRSRCLQFLNAEGSHAVRLLTPRFACGPIQGPVTVFCISIATEDGCFVSGLKRRYELGHMHPCDPRDALIDMSPVCLVTDCQRNMVSQRLSTASARMRTFSNARNMDSDDSSCEADLKNSVRESSVRCDCPFESLGMGATLGVDMDEGDIAEPREEDIYRGGHGPGLWHCYVAIFDGERSIVRIDGVTQHLNRGCEELDDDSESDNILGLPSKCGEPALDGVTIGSDHCFDMSLCYGDGVDGDGEGAIAELSYFKGHMGMTDVDRIERYLMKKHGIPQPTSFFPSAAQEDEWRRQAHALIVQPPPWKLTGDPVPLRVAANHKSVSWQRKNSVNGKGIRVSRIGSKLSTGSSDW